MSSSNSYNNHFTFNFVHNRDVESLYIVASHSPTPECNVQVKPSAATERKTRTANSIWLFK